MIVVNVQDEQHLFKKFISKIKDDIDKVMKIQSPISIDMYNMLGLEVCF